MKLHFITTSYPLYDGHMAGHFVQTLALHLIERGHDVNVWAPNDGQHSEYRQEGPIQVHRFDYFPKGQQKKLVYGQGILPNLKAHPAKATLELAPFVRALNFAGKEAGKHCDLVHAHWTVSGRGVPRNVPLVISARGSDLSGAGGPIVQRASQTILKRATVVIAENNQLAETARQHCEHVHVLGNGVSLNTYRANHDRSILQGTPLAEKKTIFLFVGRLSQVKGADRLINALSHLKNDQDWGVVFIGEGPLRSVISSAGLDNHVLLTGELPTKEVIPYYHAADALVVTSRYEGRPNNVMEALACGLPVVSVDIPGVQEMIEPGFNGFLFEGKRSEDLARGLSNFITNEHAWPTLRANARRFAEKHLDWEKVVDAYEHIYRKAIQAC